MRCSVFAVALLAALFAATPAFAQANDGNDWDGGFKQKGERRSDLVLGFSPGLVLGLASGYPNEIDKIDEPAFKAESGLAAGFGFEAWLGGALTDWFTFGVGGGYFGGNGSKGSTSGGAFLVRVETFPLFSLGGHLRDVAIFANFGAGSLKLEGEGDPGKDGDAGLASIGGFGVAYELARVGHFAFAPSAEYLLIASPSLSAHQLLLGARVVFYGGPG